MSILQFGRKSHSEMGRMLNRNKSSYIAVGARVGEDIQESPTSPSKILSNCERFILVNISDSGLLNCLFHSMENGCQLLNFDSVC